MNQKRLRLGSPGHFGKAYRVCTIVIDALRPLVPGST